MGNTSITFSVISRGRRPKPTEYSAFLRTDNWDDFGFKTTFTLLVSSPDGELLEIGDVKIGQFNMGDEETSPDVPDMFTYLDKSFFSIGQDESYYVILNKLGNVIRDNILLSLKDIAADHALFEKAILENVTKTSLLRFVSETTIRNQFRRIIKGRARLTKYNFTYQLPKSSKDTDTACTLSFIVEPETIPPSNVHVLIGRNGVGKTRILNFMAQSLVHKTSSKIDVGNFSSDGISSDDELFANIVSVSFSAFDPFTPIIEQHINESKIKHSYVGLKRSEKNNDGDTITISKTNKELKEEFILSLRACRSAPRSVRWGNALSVLEYDLYFKESDLMSIHHIQDTNEFRSKAGSIFDGLGAGHKIVLLTIIRLIETVAERSLVLLDEPEAHLHPPLLSAFVRTLSDLLIDRNGVAIIATHSPVILQEVPKSCVWKLSRIGKSVKVERPEIETFGENVGILTREAFGLEVTHSGFHKLIQDAVQEDMPYRSVINLFNGELGAEARAIIHALIVARDAEDKG